MNNADMVDLVVFDGLYEIFYGYHMGITAENIADLYRISRKEQDGISVISHQRAKKAIAEGLFKEEIVLVFMGLVTLCIGGGQGMAMVLEKFKQ